MRLFPKPRPSGDQWFQDAGDPSTLISLSRFVSEQVFVTHAGGYGATFAVVGVDDECLSEEALAGLSTELLAGQRLVPDNVVTYYIARKRRGHVPEHRHIGSANRIVAQTQQARQDHLASMGFASIDLFLTVYVPPREGMQVWTPRAHSKATELQLRQLEDAGQMLSINLHRFGLRRLAKTEICDLYGYIANLQGNYSGVSASDRISRLLARERVQWNDDGLKVGLQHARIFSLLHCPKATQPNLFGELLRLQSDMILILETQRRSADETRKEASRQETFSNVFRERIRTLIAYIGDPRGRMFLAAASRSAASQSADKAVSGIAGILDDLKNGVAYTQSSLIGVLHSEDLSEVTTQMAHVHRVAGKSQALFLQEGIGALSAFTALFPGARMGGRSTNVRRLWLREDHAANLSLVYSPYRGEPVSETLENEALAYLETRDGTEFAYDPYTPSGVRGCFVMGETGRGKTFLLNFIIDNEPKYGGYVFIFDVGGGFESTVLKHGGSVVRFGLTGPRLNPFALEDNERNHRFAQRLVRLLLLKAGADLRPEQEMEINKRVVRLFSLDRPVRRLSSLILPTTIQPYLAKWLQGGIYGDIFDNVEDELDLQRMVVFDFEALGEGQEQSDLMEPLLAWIRWRIADYTQDADNLGVPKLEIYDEVWRHLKDEQISSMIINTTKTARKHLGGIMMATHSVGDLGQYANLIRTNCPDAMFMGGNFSRHEYELFKLNPHQLDLIDSLKQGEFLLARTAYSKILKLSVDDQSHWLYTSRPQDRKRRAIAIAQYGRENAFRHLAEEAVAG